jgi:hypothetical protein
MVEVGQDRAALKIVPVVGCAMICTILQWLYTPLLRPTQQTGGQARRRGETATRRDGDTARGRDPCSVEREA